MPRRREVPKRRILPDSKYHDLQLAKFTNVLMYDGKKSTAEQIAYGALAAWVQTDMKKLVAYSSVSHLGFCILGMFSLKMFLSATKAKKRIPSKTLISRLNRINLWP